MNLFQPADSEATNSKSSKRLAQACDVVKSTPAVTYNHEPRRWLLVRPKAVCNASGRTNTINPCTHRNSMRTKVLVVQ